MNPAEPPEDPEAPGSAQEGSVSPEESGGTRTGLSKPESAPIVREIHQAVREELRFFSGPLPPPDVLAEYNRVFPDCGKAIVEMAQKEQQHRHDHEAQQIKAEYTLARRGQLIGATLAMIAVAGAIYLLAHDKSITGLSVLGAVVVAFGGAFIYDRYQFAKLSEGQRPGYDEATQKLKPTESEPESTDAS
jgi:uncharacterized membrane protein